MHHWLERAEAFCIAPVEARRMRVFECLFTLTFLANMGRCLADWKEWLTPWGFHLTSPEMRSIGYPEPWPLVNGVTASGFALAVVAGSAGLLFNRWRRLSLFILLVCAVFAQRVDYMSSYTLNKLYVGIYGLLALGPRMWRDSATGLLMQSAAPLRVIQATLILQYFAAGLAKADGGDWLKSHDILWGHVQGVYRTELAAWCLRHFPLWLWSAQQHVALAFELLAPLLFILKRLRWAAIIVGMGFHLLIAVMMRDLIFFSVQMWTFYALFWPDTLPRDSHSTR